MHLLDRYALSCGVAAEKPFIDESYFPLVYDKYIVFQTSGKGNARQYDYWSKVFAFIREYTKDYKIVHVGVPSDQSVADCDLDLRGKTTIKHLAYLIKNSSLYLGVDSLSAHFAGFYDKKLVALYSYCYAQNCRPVWGSPENQSIIEVDWKKHGKPSFSNKEEEKKINTIYPEVIAKAVLDKLGIANDLDKVETVFIGKDYHTPVIEIIPDQGRLPMIVKDKVCNVRMDYFFGPTQLSRLASACFLNIVTDKPIDIQLISPIVKKIAGMTLIINDSFSLEYLNDLKSLGIQFSLTAPDDSNWGRLAEKYFDFNLEKDIVSTKNDVKGLGEINDSYFFSSEKIVISDSRVFANKICWKNDQQKLDRYSKVIDSPDFWQEVQHFHILKDERTKI